jgi:hypothetical protein
MSCELTMGVRLHLLQGRQQRALGWTHHVQQLVVVVDVIVVLAEMVVVVVETRIVERSPRRAVGLTRIQFITIRALR